MAVRIKLRVKSKSTGKELEVNALVNSGFETIKPQLLTPVKVAESLGLWPLPHGAYEVKEYVTAGGSIKNYVISDEIEVKVVVEYDTDSTLCDIVISPIEDEVLISDKLAGKLGLEVYDFAEGIWKLKSDPSDIRRKSVEPQIW